MPPRSCFICGCSSLVPCNTDQTNKESERCSLYCTPRNKERFEKWEETLSFLGKKLGKSSVVCERHFKTEDKDNYYEVKLKDGTVWKEKKGKPGLKPGAIPCLFIDIPFRTKRKLIEYGAANTKKASCNEENIKGSTENHTNEVVIVASGKNIIEVPKSALSSAKASSTTPSISSKKCPVSVLKSSSNKNQEVAIVTPLNSTNVEDFTNIDDVTHSESGDDVPSSVSGDIVTKRRKVTNSPDIDQVINFVGGDVVRRIAHNPIADRLQSFRQDLTTFNYLKEHVHEIEIATAWWAVHAFESYIACARWNSDWDIDRKIVIKNDLTVKVYLEHNKEVNCALLNKVKSIEAISTLMNSLEGKSNQSKENEKHVDTDEVIAMVSGKSNIEVPKKVLLQDAENSSPLQPEISLSESSVLSQKLPDPVLKSSSNQNQEVVIKDLNEVDHILKDLAKGKYDSVITPQIIPPQTNSKSSVNDLNIKPQVVPPKTYSKSSTTDSINIPLVMPPLTNSKSSTTDSVIIPQVIPPLTNSKSSTTDSTIISQVVPPLTNSKSSTTDSDIIPRAMQPLTNFKSCSTDSVIGPQVMLPLANSKATNINSVIVITSPSPNNLYTVTDVLTEAQLVFRTLKENIHNIPKETPWWTICALENSIVCARWDSNNEVDRKIVVKNDLTFKVFMENKEVKFGTEEKMKTVEMISWLMFKLEHKKVCSKFHENSGRCDVFLQGYVGCQQRKLCLSCMRLEKEQRKEEKRLKKEEKEAEELVELLRFEFKF